MTNGLLMSFQNSQVNKLLRHLRKKSVKSKILCTIFNHIWLIKQWNFRNCVYKVKSNVYFYSFLRQNNGFSMKNKNKILIIWLWGASWGTEMDLHGKFCCFAMIRTSSNRWSVVRKSYKLHNPLWSSAIYRREKFLTSLRKINVYFFM